MEAFDNLKESVMNVLESGDKRVFAVIGAAIVIIGLVWIFLLPTPVSEGTLTVIVKDSTSGEAIRGATVKVNWPESGSALSEKTLKDGKAVFEVPTGKELSITINASGYPEKSVKHVLDGSKGELVVSLRTDSSETAEFRSITFTGPEGIRLEGKLITAQLTCSSGVVIANSLRQVSDGRLELEKPAGCGVLSARVSASGFETTTVNLDGDSSVIRLESILRESARAIVVVKDESGKFLNGISVYVLDPNGIPLGERELTKFGEAVFSLMPGIYTVVASDPSSKFGDAETPLIISGGIEARAEIVMGKEPLGVVKAVVLDQGDTKVSNALVVLEGPSGRKVSREFLGEAVSFPLSEEGAYRLVASADGYSLSDSFEFDSDNIPGSAVELSLEECTPLSCGVLKVNVKDEDNEIVRNARVSLLNPETGFFVEEYRTRITNFEGTATFPAVESGNYIAVVQKFPAEGRSAEFDFVEGQDSEVDVKLVIGKGIITVEAVDELGSELPFGSAAFIEDSSDETGQGVLLGRLPLNSSGKASIELKAGKKVFIRVTADGYAPFTTAGITVYPDNEVNVVAELQKDKISDTPEIKLEGIFDEVGKKTSSVKTGKIYSAKFRITMPEDASDSYDELGAFVRVGDEKEIEKENFYISGVNAPSASFIMGSTFNPPKGTQEDEDNITNSNAKWVSVLWGEDSINGGIIEFEARIVATQSFTAGDELPLYYRTYAITNDSEVLRDPFDSELGNAEDSSGKEALYAYSYSKSLSGKSVDECLEGFCYSESMLDGKNDIYVDRPYYLRIFGNYKLEFTISNDSEAFYDNSQIRIRSSKDGISASKNLSINSYKIINSDSTEFSSSTDTFEIDPINLGSKFSSSKEIKAELNLKPKELGEAGIEVKIISDKREVFSKTIPVEVVKEEDLQTIVLPETLPSFTEFDMNVSVKSSAEDDISGASAVDAAFIRVDVYTPEGEKLVFTTYTNNAGDAKIRMPEFEPGTKVRIRVEKDGFAGISVNKEVSKEIVYFKPARLSSSLDLTSNTESKQSLEMRNLVPIELSINRMLTRGNFYGLIDTQRMDNWLGQYVKKTLGKDFLETTILSAITDDAQQLLDKPKKMKGTILVELADKKGNAKWPLEVPIDFSINLAEPPKNDNCLEVSLKNWKDATLGGRAETEFFITNNCVTANNKPLDLRNLKAMVDWDSSKFGSVELRVTDQDNGQEAASVLGQGIFSDLFESVPGGKNYTALLIFTPKGGTIGEKAKFDVIIDAGQNTNAGEQLVGATNPISAEIDIIDLTQCITYNPDPEAGLVIGPEEASGQGTILIDSSACGNVDIDFWLCRYDDDCSGGTEGGIIVEPQKFTLTPKSSKKTVTVTRQEIPGIYGLTVDVRTPGSNYREVSLIDVIAKPTFDDAFSLSKYEFSLIGNGSQDSAQLTNSFLSEPITVDASVCDWGEASEKEWWDWTGAGVGAVVGALMGVKPAMEAAKLSAKTTSQAAGNSLQAAKQAGNASKTATKTSTASLEELCGEIDMTETNLVTAQGACAVAPTASGLVTAAHSFVVEAQAECNSLIGTSEAAEQTTDNAIAALDTVGTGTALVQGKELVKGKEEKEGKTIYLSGNDYVVPVSIGIGVAAVAIPVIIAKYTAKKTGIELINAKLTAAQAKLTAAQGALAADITATEGAASECSEPLSVSSANVGQNLSKAESYSNADLATGATKAGTFQSTTNAAQQSTANAGKAITPAVNSGKSLITPTNVMGLFTVGGFFVGGLYKGLFGPDPCDMRHTGVLPDYVINILAEDTGAIKSEVDGLSAIYNKDSAKVIGNYEKQKIGIVFSNNGVKNDKPIYSTFSFPVKQHMHANPTTISKGNSNFGPFSVPDSETLSLEQKIHLKFKTTKAEEELPELDFDTVSCISGNKIGRTGKGALPKVKLEWGFGSGGITSDSCLEQNSDGIYCDSVQFSIMLSKRLESLRKFFELNPELSCPQNPLSGSVSDIAVDLNANFEGTEGDCYISDWSGYIEDEPAIKFIIEANENNINWTSEIPNKTAFMDTIHFNAILMKDGYSDDLMKDFAKHYSEVEFFDTPDWFYGLGAKASGGTYGIANLFSERRISFTNRFFDSTELSSAGTYEVLINLKGENGKFNFFNSNGTPNAEISVQLYLLEEPNPDSVFYSLPIDGAVGLNGDSLNRQGYGSAFDNTKSNELVTVNKAEQPVKSYADSGSNAISTIVTDVEKGIYALNTSPSGRGNLLNIEAISPTNNKIIFSPSKATPVMMRVSVDELSGEKLSAFYTVTNSEVPVEIGSSMLPWDGAGACLDPTGVVITEAFDEKPDRPALTHDPVLNWETAYGVDFGVPQYKGDSYLRTIFYSSPKDSISIIVENPKDKMAFLTPDESGSKVHLNGVGGVAYNNPAGGSSGQVSSMEDIFSLVENETVCVTDSGREASFFWNPKAVYEMSGSQRNISIETNGLIAGKTCIGLG